MIDISCNRVGINLLDFYLCNKKIFLDIQLNIYKLFQVLEGFV